MASMKTTIRAPGSSNGQPVQIAERTERLNALMRPFDRSHPHNRLGSLPRFAVMGFAAIRAHDLGIVIGHFVQEGGKRLTTVRA